MPAAHGQPACKALSGPFNVCKIVHVIDGPHGAIDVLEGDVLGALYGGAIGQGHGMPFQVWDRCRDAPSSPLRYRICENLRLLP